uniref:DUF4587 domain-containing protein n=1 Tax=Sander lucioperca TaxID=283035 RepID=A0A8C9ZP09_SANLU
EISYRVYLVELMMIQNAQMHQVIMNNMTMSALSSFGYSSPLPGPAVENEADPEIHHHYYQSMPCISYPAWFLPQATLVYQDPINGVLGGKNAWATTTLDRCKTRKLHNLYI